MGKHRLAKDRLRNTVLSFYGPAAHGKDAEMVFTGKIIPICSALHPFIHFHRSRRINRNMYVFLTFMFLFLGIYITFTLSINDFIFTLFGFTAVVFVLSFSIAYLQQENPFSDQEKKLNIPVPMLQAHTEPVVLPFFHTIENVLQSDLSFVHPDYELKDLAKAIGVKTSAVSASLQNRPSTGTSPRSLEKHH